MAFLCPWETWPCRVFPLPPNSFCWPLRFSSYGYTAAYSSSRPSDALIGVGATCPLTPSAPHTLGSLHQPPFQQAVLRFSPPQHTQTQLHPHNIHTPTTPATTVSTLSTIVPPRNDTHVCNWVQETGAVRNNCSVQQCNGVECGAAGCACACTFSWDGSRATASAFHLLDANDRVYVCARSFSFVLGGFPLFVVHSNRRVPDDRVLPGRFHPAGGSPKRVAH